VLLPQLSTIRCFLLYSMDSRTPMDVPTRRDSLATADSRYDDQQEQEQIDKEEEIRIHNTEETPASSAVPLPIPSVLSLESQTMSPQTVSGVMEGFSGRFPMFNEYDTIQLPRTRPRSLSAVPSRNLMPATAWNLPNHLSLAASTRSRALGQVDHALLLGTREYLCSLVPQLQQRLDSLASSSLGLELASVMSRHRFDALPSPHNDGLENRLAAAQTNELLSYQLMCLRTPTTIPPNQWPSSVGRVGDRNALSHLSSLPLPNIYISPRHCAASSTSALSNSATIRVAELASSRLYGSESFPMVLHRVLKELECVFGGRTIATFLPDGRSFQIKDRTRFAKQVLPVFFPKMKGFTSFQRQLNLYNFECVVSGEPGRRVYRHEFFVRDDPAMSCDMRRTKIKGFHPVEGPLQSSSNNETLNITECYVRCGEVNPEQEAATVSKDDTELVDGKRKASDEQGPQDKHGNID
jgi:hypothetical protein